MLSKPKHPCKYSLCPELAEAGQSYCDKHKSNRDTRDSATKRGYDSRWQRARAIYLRSNPLCVECLKVGIIKAATVVDHIEPHRGDYDKFWDKSNWQSLCKRHHDIKTAEGK